MVTTHFPYLSMLSATLPLDHIGEITQVLLERTDTEKVWLDKKVHASLDVSVPLVGAPQVWAAGFRGEGIRIAVLDTGIDGTHPDLDDLDDDPATNDPKIIETRNSTNDATAQDTSGHGTHVAGIAAGTGQLSGGLYTGVAPQANLWNLKVLSSRDGQGLTSWIIAGVEFAALGEDGLPGTGDEADIINMSLGEDVQSGALDPLSRKVNWAVDQGLVVVVAAGNDGETGGMFAVTQPAVARKAIAVGASTDGDQIADFSSLGPTLDLRLKPDLVAPGEVIRSARHNGGHTLFEGTSMSTPHVAGAAALILQKHPDWTPEMVKAALLNNALPLDGPRLWAQGAGRLRVTEAVNATLLAMEPSLSFGRLSVADNTASATLTLLNLGDQEVQVSLVPNTTFIEDPTTRVEGVVIESVVRASPSTLTIAPGDSAGVSIDVGPVVFREWYEGRIQVTYPGGTLTVPYLFHCDDCAPPVPEIEVTPLSLRVAMGRDQVTTRTVSISNTGVSALVFDITGSDGPAASNEDVANAAGQGSPISVEPASGRVAPGETLEVTVTIDSTGTEPGIYTTDLLIDHNAPDQGAIPVPVTALIGVSTISGTVTLKAQADHSGTEVQFVGPLNGTVATDAAGDFSAVITPGTYIVTATHSHYLTAVTEVHLELGAEETLTVELLPGDVNNDGVIDTLDLVGTANSLGKTEAEPLTGDWNNDGIIDILDLAHTANNLGKTESKWSRQLD